MNTGFESTRVHELTRDIAAHAQRKELAPAVEAFEQLQREGHAPSVFAFCALINAHSSCADMPGALRACQRMLTASVAPNTIVLTTLIKGYVNAGETELAHELLVEMTVSGRDRLASSLWAGCPRVQPDTRAVNTLLRGCVRTGHAALAVELFERMSAEWHLEADVTTYKLVSKLCAMALDTAAIHAIVERLAPASELVDLHSGGEAAGGTGDDDALSDCGMPGGPVCMFWREGTNSCPRAALCRFRHPASILQLGRSVRPGRAGSAANGRGERVVDSRSAGLRPGECVGGGEEEEVGGVFAGRSLFVAELRLHAAHANALLQRWQAALDQLVLAERWQAQAAEEARLREASAGGGEGRWYAQLGLHEAKREANRIGAHIRSGLARAHGGGSGARSRQAGGGAFEGDVRSVLLRTFLFDDRLAPAAPCENTLRLGDGVAQRLFDTLRRAFGLDRACAVGSAGGQGGRAARAAQRAELECFAARYARCIRGRSGRLNMEQVFAPNDGSSLQLLPFFVEVASGNGDWVVAQAAATRGEANWLAAELRFDRVWQILSRMLTARTPNLACTGGDSQRLLAHHLPRGSVAHLFVNFPEPPHHSGNASAESVVELLSAAFFEAAHAALVPARCSGSVQGTNGVALPGSNGQHGGRITILSDSRPYAHTLARTIGALVSTKDGSRLFCSTHKLLPAGMGTHGEWSGMREEVSGITVHHGVPGRAQGHYVRATSYFDRFWEQGNHTERYFIDVARLTVG